MSADDGSLSLMIENLEPSGPLLLALIRKARPGISHLEALANGAHHKARVAMSDGMTDLEFLAWCDRHRGRTLVVHLGPDGRPQQPKTLALLVMHDEVGGYLEDHAGAVVVAKWGVNGS